jgi:hypothetical protein
MSRTRDAAVEEHDIGFLDPAQSFTPKALIKDILRTKYCVPRSIFLVEGVEDRIAARKGYRALRLLLGDGELCIQALVLGQMHGFVDAGEIYAGCYVRLDKFDLRIKELSALGKDVPDNPIAGPLSDGVTKRKNKAKSEKMVYLLVADLITVGWNNTYLGILEAAPKGVAPEGKEIASSSAESAEPPRSAQKPQAQSGEIDSDSDLDSAFEHMDVDLPRASQKRQGLTQKPGALRARSTNANGILRLDNNHLPWSSNDPTQPLKLTSLGSLPHLPYKQNWTMNVLAVVVSLSEVERSHLPPGKQRRARLVDPTSDREVLLTVFLDPERFTPGIGSVVLLLGVKNHTFAGGCLNKYDSDRAKHKGCWWRENPLQLEWCDVAGLKAWWDERTVS